MKTKENKRGISLIVLVITIIVIIILATAVIVTLLSNNPIASAIRAVDDSNVAKYTEQIEQIRSKLLLQSENHELPNLSQMKETLEKEKWVMQTEMIIDEGVEKLKLVTKEGYIFYITEENIEYKGKGEVVETSALKRDDVLELLAEEETEKGQYVKITSKAEEYYVIKYKIGEEENNWTEIKSGERVEVPYGKTIYAKLFYGSSSGVEFKLKIGEKNPSIVAKNIDTSNMKRKTEMVLANLFDITWGSEGSGEVEYEVEGNLVFKNTKYNSVSIENTKELEIGTYNVKCTIRTLSGYTTSAVKQVKVNQLASTSVTNESGSNINANAIYSEYDIAYFRDLINEGNSSFNARLMNDIDLANVCSIKSGSWIPIGDKGVYDNNINEDFVFKGIFDGDYHKVTNLYINNDEQMQALFKINGGKICKLQLISGNITSKNFASSLVSLNKSIISECCNYIDISYNSSKAIAGIASSNEGTISYCYNVGDISGIDSIGGIVANNRDNGIIEYCYNSGQISGDNDQIGGIVGANFGLTGGINRGIIRNSYNIGNITGSFRVGAIVGGNGGAGTFYGGTVENCYFLNSSYSTAIGHSYSALKELTYSQTVEQMKSFRINNIFIEDNANKNDGYPILKWQLDH